jgi:hypothetical protein
MTILDHSEITAAIKDVLFFDVGVARSAEERVAEAASKAVCDLLERKAREAFAEAASAYVPPITPEPASAMVRSEMSPTDIRLEAYAIAAKRPSYGVTNAEFHQHAEEIARNIERGFAKPEVDTTGKPGGKSFHDLVDKIYGRTEWRREGWNDCKAVLIRTITRQLNGEHPVGHWMLEKKHNSLANIRDFIASFNFDPKKP